MADKKSSHLGAGLLAGTILGIAAGVFLNSPKGKQMTKDVDANMKKLQKQVMKRLKEAEDMSKEKYEELVDEIVSYYQKSKQLAKKDVPEVRKFLMKKWKEIEKEMKNAAS
jgi:gas vesicle protein